jgi:hypothetical protein
VSAQKTGEYVKTNGGMVSFEPGAWVTRKSVGTLGGVKFIVNEARDITNAVSAANTIIIRDIQIGYPGGDISTIVPVGEIVLEWRPTIGKVQQRTGPDNKSRFASGYMVTYVSLGIPEEAYKFIESRIKASSGTRVDTPKLDYYDGYAWMPAKVPDEASPLTASGIDQNGDLVDFGTALEVLKATRRSILCYGTIGMRLKHTRPRGAPNVNKFDLGITVTAVQLIGLTDIKSPPLNNRVNKTLIDVRISDELADLMKSAGGIGGDAEEEEVISSAGFGPGSTTQSGSGVAQSRTA